MSSGEYFSDVDQLRRDNISLLKIFRWEVVPTQILEDYTPTFNDKSNVWGVIVFADYPAEGNHRFTIAPETKSTRVILGVEKIQAVENKEKSDYVSQKTLNVYPADATLSLAIPSADTASS